MKVKDGLSVSVVLEDVHGSPFQLERFLFIVFSIHSFI